MGFDPATMAAVATVAGEVAGDKQLGAPAQPFIPGQLGLPNLLAQQGGLPGFGGPMSALGLLAKAGNFGGDPVQDAISSIKPPPTTGPITPPQTNDSGGLLGEDNPALKAIKDADQNPTGFGGFFGNLDETLGSPAKTLGLGILGQLDPRLGLAGLLGGGLLGKNKVFGG